MLEAEAGIETATEKNVLRVLRQVNAPEAGVNIVDLELIYGTDISGRRGSHRNNHDYACLSDTFVPYRGGESGAAE